MKTALAMVFLLVFSAVSVPPPFHGASPIASVVNPVVSGIVGTVLSDNFDRLLLGSDWITNALWMDIESDELHILASTNLASRAEYGPFQTLGQNWEIHWTYRNPIQSAHTPGVGIGIKALITTRSVYGIFYSDTGSDGKKVAIVGHDNTTWSELAKSSAIASYAGGDTINCVFRRSGGTLTMVATNSLNGLGQSVSYSLSYGTSGQIAPGVQKLGIIAYKGDSNYVNGITWINASPYPQTLVTVGDSITEGSNATNHWLSYAWMLQTNKSYTPSVFAAGSSRLTNVIASLTELQNYRPAKVALMIGGNDVQLGYSTFSIESNYWYIVTNLTAAGITPIHLLPTPRDTVNVATFKNFIVSNWPTTHIDTYTNLLDGTGIAEAFDSDNVHPNALGHLMTWSNVVASPLIP
jgi:lysophospholipase L1-like esterase